MLLRYSTRGAWRVVIAAVLASAALAWAEPPAQTEVRDGDPAFLETGIPTWKGPIADIVTLRPEGTRLILDREVWNSEVLEAEWRKAVEETKARLTQRGMAEDEATRLAEYSVESRGLRRLSLKLQNEMKATRSGTRGTANGGNAATMENDRMAVEIVSGEHFAFRAREYDPLPATLEVTESRGQLGILISRLDADWILSVRQDDTRFAVIEVAGGKLTQLSEKDFATFYRKHGPYMRSRLLPVLGHYGIGALTPASPAVIAKVVELLADPIAPEEARRVDALLAQLSGGKHQQRQEAFEALKENYLRWMGFIHAAVANPANSAEAVARLKAIIDTGRGQHQELKLIHALGLLDDAAYLKEILPTLQGEKAEAVQARIRLLSGEEKP